MSFSKPRVPYKTLSFDEKIAVIREVEKGVKKKCIIAKEYGIAPNTLSTFLKNKEKILKSNRNRKRAREPDNPDVDECVLKWFTQARDKNIPLSGTLVRAKAEEFAVSLGKNNFKASSGWLDGFKERNEISFKSVCGESSSVDQGAANEWKEKVVQIIKHAQDRDIFNVDETGLFFKCTPAKTLAFKGEKCSGGKHSKDRITLLVGANMDGTEKLPLLMIGKSRNPRCFKNVRTKPIKYRSNTKAWMTANLFKEWLLDLNSTYQRKKRKIILFIDNCQAHKSITAMENVTVVFFPPNMTSVVQPMDQGVIKNLKHFYRCLVVQHLLTESSQKLPITLLDASRMCLNAWSKVSQKTIANCFRKAGFCRSTNPSELFDDEILPSPVAWEDSIPFDDYVNIDENIEICGELSDADILSEVLNNKNIPTEDDEDVEDEVEEQRPIPTSSEAAFHLAEYRRYVEGESNVSEAVFHAVDILEDFVKKNQVSSLKQSEISQYFKKL